MPVAAGGAFPFDLTQIKAGAAGLPSSHRGLQEAEPTMPDAEAPFAILDETAIADRADAARNTERC